MRGFPQDVIFWRAAVCNIRRLRLGTNSQRELFPKGVIRTISGGSCYISIMLLLKYNPSRHKSGCDCRMLARKSSCQQDVAEASSSDCLHEKNPKLSIRKTLNPQLSIRKTLNPKNFQRQGQTVQEIEALCCCPKDHLYYSV